MRRKKPIILDDESSSEEEEEKESAVQVLPKGFFDDHPENDEQEEVEIVNGDINRDLIRKIGNNVSNIPNFPVTPIIDDSKNTRFSERIPHTFKFRTPLMRIIVKFLYKHQKEGVDFLYHNIVRQKQGVVLADFMGLGKSLQIVSVVNIMAMEKKERRPILLICPKVVINHWVSEFEKFNNWVEFDRIGVKNFKRVGIYKVPNIFSNSKRVQVIKEWFSNHGVLILSYGKFVRLWSLGYKDVNDRFFSPYLFLILDEGHRIRTDKNYSRTSMALSKIRTTQKVILTGYPLQNNLVEYWYLVSFILPSFLGNLKDFRRKLAKPIAMGMDQNAVESEVYKSKIYGRILHQQLQPYILRRGIEYLQEAIPIQKREITIYCKMTKSQHRYYNSTLDLLRKKGISFLFWAHSFLTLICNHPQIARNYCIRKENSFNQLSLENPNMTPMDVKVEDEEEEEEKKEEMKDEDEEEEDNNNNNNNNKEEKEEEEEEGEIDFTKYSGDVRTPFLKPEDIEKLKEILTQRRDDETYPNNNNDDDDNNSNHFESNKISVLLHLLYGAKRAGDKVVVFTKSIMTLDFIEKLLTQEKTECGPRISRIDGGMELSLRQKRINMFNEKGSAIDAILISTLSCCEGVNLYAANRVILMDVNWNPSNDVEATSRVYRFGQKKHVSIYRLVTYGSMENRVHVRQLQKMKLFGLICDDKNMNLMDSMISEKDLVESLPETYGEYIKSLPEKMVDRVIVEGGVGFDQDKLWTTINRLLMGGEVIQARTQASLLRESLGGLKNEVEDEEEDEDEDHNMGEGSHQQHQQQQQQLNDNNSKIDWGSRNEYDQFLFSLKQDGFFEESHRGNTKKKVEIPNHLLSPDTTTTNQEKKKKKMKDEDDEEEEEDVIIISRKRNKKGRRTRNRRKKELSIEIPEKHEEMISISNKSSHPPPPPPPPPSSQENDENDVESRNNTLPPHLTISPNDFGSNWFESIAKKKSSDSEGGKEEMREGGPDGIPEFDFFASNSSNPSLLLNNNNNNNVQTTSRNVPFNHHVHLGQRESNAKTIFNSRRRNNNNNNNNNVNMNMNMGRRIHNNIPPPQQQQQNQQNQQPKSYEEFVLERQVNWVVDNAIVKGAFFQKNDNTMTFRKFRHGEIPQIPQQQQQQQQRNPNFRHNKNPQNTRRPLVSKHHHHQQQQHKQPRKPRKKFRGDEAKMKGGQSDGNRRRNNNQNKKKKSVILNILPPPPPRSSVSFNPPILEHWTRETNNNEIKEDEMKLDVDNNNNNRPQEGDDDILSKKNEQRRRKNRRRRRRKRNNSKKKKKKNDNLDDDNNNNNNNNNNTNDSNQQQQQKNEEEETEETEEEETETETETEFQEEKGEEKEKEEKER